MTPVGVERIQDKTRWTKAVGEAVTIVYGDCKVEIGQRRNSRMNAGQFFKAAMGCERVVERNRESANKTRSKETG